MPYFIYVVKVPEDLWIEVSVGVGEEADAGHGRYEIEDLVIIIR